MKPKTDLYDWLDVSRTADEATIRKAFRKRSKETHPDVGGASGDFELTRTALLVLKDPRRRDRYDRTGEVDDEFVDNDIANAISQIGKIITIVIEETIAGKGSIERHDVLKKAKESLRGAIESAEKGLAAVDIREQAVNKLAERFKRKPDPKKVDGVRLAINGFKSQLDKTREMTRDRIASYKLALEILEEYDYTVDPDPWMAVAGVGDLQFSNYFYIRGA